MAKKACIVYPPKKLGEAYTTQSILSRRGYKIQDVVDVQQCDDDTEQFSFLYHEGAFPSLDKFKFVDEVELFGGSTILDCDKMFLNTLHLAAQEGLSSFKNAKNACLKHLEIEGSLVKPSFLKDLTKLSDKTRIMFESVATKEDDEESFEGLEGKSGRFFKKGTGKELERFLTENDRVE